MLCSPFMFKVTNELNTFIYLIKYIYFCLLFICLFNDTVIWHQTSGKDSERGHPLLPYGLLFPISSIFFLYSSSHSQDNTYHSFCYTSHGALAETRNSSMGSMKDRSDNPSHHVWLLLPRCYISLL